LTSKPEATLSAVALKIRSSRDGALLVIDRTFRSEYNCADLSYGQMKPAVEFYAPNLSTLSSFFSELGGGMARLGVESHRAVPGCVTELSKDVT
jgi:hypothetical protein